jgi:hypothetical protein
VSISQESANNANNLLRDHVGVDHQATVDRAHNFVNLHHAALHRNLGHHRHRGLPIRIVAGDATPVPFRQRRAPVGPGGGQFDHRPQQIGIAQQRHSQFIGILMKRGRDLIEETFIGEGVRRVDHRTPGPSGQRNVGE